MEFGRVNGVDWVIVTLISRIRSHVVSLIVDHELRRSISYLLHTLIGKARVALLGTRAGIGPPADIMVW